MAMSNPWQNLTSDLKASFSGKPRLSDIPQREGTQDIPVDVLMRRVFATGERAFQIHMMHNDPVFERYSHKDIDEIIRIGVEVGRQYAREISQLNLTWRQAMRYFDIDYREQTKPDTAERVFFAQYVEPNKLTVFTDVLDRYAKSAFVKDKTHDISVHKAHAVLVGHELFHFLEYRDRGSIVTRNFTVVTHKLGPLKLKATPASLSEIAAMAFTKEWLGLDYSPNVYDVLFMHVYEPKAAALVLEDIERSANLKHQAKHKKEK
ncbi:hypothetical protein ACFQY8_02550 [Alloscardovia venturai]|uniref:Uncharacterized protein n=1 Tax=Alloscardovia venturai TaxID=1769421 RepID=A0ABW2Y7R5_9BIFI